MKQKISLNNLYVAMLGTVEAGSVSGAYTNIYAPVGVHYVHFEPKKYIFVNKGIFSKSTVTDVISSQKYIPFSEASLGDTCVIVLDSFKQVLLEYAPPDVINKHLKNGYLTIEDAMRYVKEINSHNDISFEKIRKFNNFSICGDITFEEYHPYEF